MNKSIIDNDSINLILLFSKIYKSRAKIIKFSFKFLLIGIVISVFIPNKFSSHTTFVPQISSDSKSSNSLSGLASLAGISLSDNYEISEISPLLYPQIVESAPFKLELLESKIFISNDNAITLREFLLEQNQFNLLGSIKKYTIGLPALIINKFKQDKSSPNNSSIDLYSVSPEDQKLFDILSNLVKINLNEKERFITISSTHQEKTIPAQIAKNAELILQNKIIDHKSSYSKEILAFSESQYKEKRRELNKLQDEIAIFKDQNININSSLFQNKLDRLLSESQVLQTVVQQLASQVEQAKLQVNKDTPVFTVIQPANIPNKKSGPNRTLLVIIFFMTGLIVSSVYELFIDNVKSLYLEVTS